MQTNADPVLNAEVKGDTLHLSFGGVWKIGAQTDIAGILTGNYNNAVKKIVVNAEKLETYDSILAVYYLHILEFAREHKLEVDGKNLPKGILGLTDMSLKSQKHEDKTDRRPPGFFAQVGDFAFRIYTNFVNGLNFTGEIILGLGRLFTGKARFKKSEVWHFIQSAGADALPIVSLISFLVGVILAFVGSMQLALFGAEIYTANLILIIMGRELGAIMAGIVMAARTATAFAAQIGSMQANEEVDALKTLGISPFDFLVTPRMIALILMMPFLCIYADLLGVLGGFFVVVGTSDISLFQYWEQTKTSLHFWTIASGFIKSFMFGALVAFSGCFKGMYSGRSAGAVGEAATQAAVLAIVLIIVCDAIMAVVFSALGI